MGSAFPGCVTLADQPQIRFVDERRWLECVTGSLGSHSLGGAGAKLPVDEGEEFMGSGRIASSHAVEEMGEIVGRIWSPDLSPWCAKRPGVRLKCDIWTFS